MGAFLFIKKQRGGKMAVFAERFDLRISAEEKMKLEQLAYRNSKSKSEILRELVNISFEKINLANKTSLAN